MNLGRETETLEFKKSTGELKEGIVSIGAILNKHQKGELYFGVRPDGTPIGQEISEKRCGTSVRQSPIISSRRFFLRYRPCASTGKSASLSALRVTIRHTLRMMLPASALRTRTKVPVPAGACSLPEKAGRRRGCMGTARVKLSCGAGRRKAGRAVY